jgi:Xaa-Pro aminopeptidase
MTYAILLYGDTTTNPDLRHQVPVEIHDPLLFAGQDGRRVVVTTVLEEPRVRAAGDYEVLLLEELGREALARQAGSRALGDRRAMQSAIAEMGIATASVPSSFPLAFARELEAAGVGLVVDDERFVELRRRKTAGELSGIRRAQAAADAAVQAVRDVLAQASGADGELQVDGTPLTVERLKRVVRARLEEHAASLDAFILSHGSQTAIGHHLGEGTLRTGEPIILDLWPTDRASGCCTDLTRTFVVGEPPERLREWHGLCRTVLDLLLPEVRPGAVCEDLHTLVCEFFESHGHRTPLSQPPGEVLLDGFPYALGHGVGLQLHEPPALRQGERGALIAGDVIAIEPALYEQGFGGVRTESVYLVTDDGPEPLCGLGDDLLVG